MIVKELKQKVIRLKAEVKELRNQNAKSIEETNSIFISQDHELENRVASLESSKPPNESTPSSPKLTPNEKNHESFLSVISCIDFKK